MNKQIAILARLLVFCACGGVLANDLKRPLFVVHAGHGWHDVSQQIWSNIPEDIRPHFAAEVCAHGKRSATERTLKDATKFKIPVILRARGVWPYDFSPPIPLSEISSYLEEWPMIAGVSVTELMNGSFTGEERDYIIELADICRETERPLLWFDSFAGSEPWLDIGIDKKLFEAVQRNRKWIIPVWEAVEANMLYPAYSSILGLYLTKTVEQWGVNPQTWLWKNAGFGKRGEFNPYNKGFREETPDSFYTGLLMFGAMSGASVFVMGGESPPHIWTNDKERTPAPLWKQSVEPLIRFLIDNPQTIPDRAQVAKHLTVGWQPAGKELHSWLQSGGADGEKCVVLHGNMRSFAWSTERWIPVESGKEYTLSAAVKPKVVSSGGQALASVYWNDANAKGWPFLSETRSIPIKTGSDQWQELTMTAKAPDSSTHAVIVLLAEHPSGQPIECWFDNIVFKDGTGDNLVPNPSFEQGEVERGFPAGWATTLRKHDADVADYGVTGELYKKLWGINGWGEVFGNVADGGLIALLPAAWKGDNALIPDKRVAHKKEELGKLIAQAAENKSEACPGSIKLEYADVLFLASSDENGKSYQAVSGRLWDVDIQADLASSHWVCVKKKSAASYSILVASRRELGQEVTLSSSKPFTVNQINASQERHQYIFKYSLTAGIPFASLELNFIDK